MSNKFVLPQQSDPLMFQKDLWKSNHHNQCLDKSVIFKDQILSLQLHNDKTKSCHLHGIFYGSQVKRNSFQEKKN